MTNRKDTLLRMFMSVFMLVDVAVMVIGAFAIVHLVEGRSIDSGELFACIYVAALLLVVAWDLLVAYTGTNDRDMKGLLITEWASGYGVWYVPNLLVRILGARAFYLHRLKTGR